MIRNIRRTFPLLAALGLAVGAAACSDNPVDPHDDHAEPVEVVIKLSGEELARAAAFGGSVTGGLSVAAGEETTHLTVVFVDEHGDELEPDEDEYLEVVVDDDTVAGFEQDTPGEFGGHLHGVAAGTTQIQFKLMHGAVGSGHPDFDSALIPVTVTQ